jgi:uncharacterized protein with GYD domain
MDIDHERCSLPTAHCPAVVNLAARPVLARRRNRRGLIPKEGPMATYIILANFTDQGIRNVKDTVKRSEAFKEMAGKKDAKVRDLFWTLGAYDIVAIVDAPNDEAITGIGLTLGMQGNVRTQTLRAYNAGEIGKILGKVG